jgi:hypothetical protein
MTDRELMQMALDTLEKLADETPTTHVRVGKAKTVDGKEIVALWFDDCSDPIQQAMYINATKPAKLKEFLKQVRVRLPLLNPEPNSYAGVSIWIGEHRITHRLTKIQIEYEIDPGMSITAAAQKCLDLIAEAKEKSE